MAERKYEFIEESTEYHGRTLYRIRALKSFVAAGYYHVKEGDLGGWIESEANLSQKDCAWVADAAVVSGEAKVSGDSLVRDSAVVSGNAMIIDSVIEREAVVRDNAVVKNHCVVGDSAKIEDEAKVKNYSEIYGKSKIKHKAIVSAGAILMGVCLVCKCAKVFGGHWCNVFLDGKNKSSDIKRSLERSTEQHNSCSEMGKSSVKYVTR